MKTLCLILFGSVLLARSALSTVCPGNFDERFSGELKESDPQRPLFRLLKNDVRDGYEPGEELTLTLHSLVASRPMKGFVVTAKSIDGRCGNGRMVAQRSSGKIRPGCQNVIESVMTEWKNEMAFGFRAPECGCVMIKATVMAAMHDTAYVDAAGVFEGPLTLTLCPWPEPATNPPPPRKQAVEEVDHVEYKPKDVVTAPVPFDEEVATTETTLIDLIDADSDEEDEYDIEDEFDDLEDALSDDDDDDDSYEDEDDVVVVDVGEIEEEDDDEIELDDEDSSDSSDLDSSSEGYEEDSYESDSSDLDSSSEDYEEVSSESDESESSEESQYPARRRPWSKVIGARRMPGRRMTHRRQHGRRGHKMPLRRPQSGRGPARFRRPGYNYRVPPMSPAAARVNGRFNRPWRKTGVQRVSPQKPKHVISRFAAQKMIPQVQKAIDQKMGFPGRRFGLLRGKKNPLGLVRHHLMGPPDFLIDRLCLTIEKILDEPKAEDSMNSPPFQMPHFFGCPESTGHERPTYRKRGPPGYEQAQAKRRMGEFDTAEIKRRWQETKQHTKSCCGKTGESRYACIRRQRMDVVCAPDFQVPLCSNPSTTLVRWKIAEARETCCGMKGVERYDCFNRTTHPVAGHPVLNHRGHGSRQPVELEELEKQLRETTQAPPREKEPTETAVIPEDKSKFDEEFDVQAAAPTSGPVESDEDDQSTSEEEDDWLEDIIDNDRDELGNHKIGTYKPKQQNTSLAGEPEAELEATPDDTSDDIEMKRDFIEDIAMPVWKRRGLVERLSDLKEEAEEILGEDLTDEDLDDEDFRYSDEDLDDDDEEFDEDEDSFEIEEEDTGVPTGRRRPGHRRPRRRNVLKKCCWAGKRASQNATSHRWAACVAKSKAIGNKLHGLVRRKCKAVFRRCCIRTTIKENISKKQASSPVKEIIDAVKPIEPVVIQNVPSHVMAQVKKHIKTAWKPRIYKPRIRILDEPEEELTKGGAE